MKKRVALVCLLLLSFISIQASESKPYQMPRTKVQPIKDSENDRQYELYIKLPEEYSENTDVKYPVIYTTDAILHFEMLSGTTEFMMPDVILVGISYQKDLDMEREFDSRFRDYSVTEYDDPEIQAKYQGGHASTHLDFIRNDVIRYIESNYRADPNERTYFGYSLGGAFGAYILLAEPDTFKHYIFGSPVNQRSAKFFDEFETKVAPQQQDLNADVFVSIGELEESDMDSIKNFVSVLQRRGPAGIRLTGLELIEDSDHETAFPETVVRSIKWLSQLGSKSRPVKGPYLGQEPPGITPKVFAPGIVSTERWEYGGVFSPDMKEFYLLKDDESEQTSFVVFQYDDGHWQESVISPRVGQPFISPDGKTMHLGRRYKERTETGWSEIRSLGAKFEDIRIMRLTASSKGTYYFDEAGTDGDGRIRYSGLVDGQREEPRVVSEEINSGTWLAHPFIAPDESYIIWDGRRDGGFGSSDIYISFRQQDGSWGTALNLGDKVNTEAWEASASVTPDGKYLFFHRSVSEGNVDIFWVDARVIESLKHKQ